ncbi:endonuclease [Paramecium bursaria Chlorella virus AP110A]|nr:endonuclease [Paramecium bursaria Chlorella virus AP110A]
MQYPPIPTKNNMNRMRKIVDSIDIPAVSSKSSLENEILMTKQLLLKKARERGITFEKKTKVENMAKILGVKLKTYPKKSSPAKSSPAKSSPAKRSPVKSSSVKSSSVKSSSVKSSSVKSSPVKSSPAKSSSSKKLITSYFPKKEVKSPVRYTPLVRRTPLSPVPTLKYIRSPAVNTNIYRKTKMTPAIETKTKKHEVGFVNKFNKHFATPKNVILRDTYGNVSKIIPNVYGARVLFDSRALSPHIRKSEELGRIVTSKADIALFTRVDGKKIDLAWISHKQPVYMQYADISADVSYFTQKNAEREIKSFKNKMLELVKTNETGLCWPRYKNGQSLRVWGKVQSDILKNMSIFGVEYGKAYGRNNANIIFTGDPKVIEQTGNTIVMSSSGKSLLNGHLDQLPAEYQPIFFVKPTEAAKTKIDKKTIRGVSLWLIRREYAKDINKPIDLVLQDKDTLVGSCPSAASKSKK